MKRNKNNVSSKINSLKKPIVKMIEDRKRIEKAIENGESLSALKGVKIVSPL